jgi:hypothetical protein
VVAALLRGGEPLGGVCRALTPMEIVTEEREPEEEGVEAQVLALPLDVVVVIKGAGLLAELLRDEVVVADVVAGVEEVGAAAAVVGIVEALVVVDGEESVTFVGTFVVVLDSGVDVTEDGSEDFKEESIIYFCESQKVKINN